MKPCKYREVNHAGVIRCNNFVDMVQLGDGIVTEEFCSHCPFCKIDSKDFFLQTASLLLKKQRAGEYRPNPKPCGGCGDTKHRRPDQDFDMQFVWPYWHGGAKGDEIRFSVRSVEKFFDGRAKCTIIGDKPPWFTGHYISKARLPDDTPYRSYRDMLSKVWLMATHVEVDTEFVWMMDDVYFLRPFTYEEISVPRAERFRQSDANSWQLIKADSMERLRAKGRTNHDYATHAPHVAEKEKLHSIFNEFDMHTNTLTWELIYGNTFHGDPERCRPYLSRIGTHMEMEQVAHVCRNSSVLNHTSEAWCKGIRDYLLAILPDPCLIEDTTQPIAPDYSRSKQARNVKRRPVETHRAYIEAHQ